jgi:hypothetical protein
MHLRFAPSLSQDPLHLGHCSLKPLSGHFFFNLISWLFIFIFRLIEAQLMVHFLIMAKSLSLC